MPDERSNEQDWYKFLTEGEPIPRHIYHLNGLLPSDPRCKLCASPFKGWGGFLMHLLGKDQSTYNPRFCQPCEKFDHPGGAEVSLTMLFADVRDSTKLAESMSAREFGRLINRFYTVATHVLVQTDALVDRLMGDEAIGLYLPGFAGREHPRKAIEAVRESGGAYVEVTDKSILCAIRSAGRLAGVFAEPAAAAAIAGVRVAIDRGFITAKQNVLCMVTGSGLKDIKSAMQAAGAPIDIPPELSAVKRMFDE